MNKLSSEERMERFYSGEKIDRIPMLSCATMYAGQQEGLNSKEFYFDVEKSFVAQQKVCQRGGYDDTPCYDLPHGEMLDFGGNLIIPETEGVALPKVGGFPICSLEDAWDFKLPPVKERLFTQYRIAFLKYAEKRGNMGVSIGAGSPFTMVGSMVETGVLLRWMVKEPDTVRHLLDLAIDYLCETADIFIREFGLERCSVSSNYPFESSHMISPKNFEKFAYPAMMEIHERLRRKGLQSFGIHLCGNHRKHLQYFKDLGLHDRSFISSDEENPLTEVAEVLGRDNIYGGNVSSRLLVQGSPEEVFKQSKRIIEEMKGNEGGFVLMPSCDLPINTKPENLNAMLRAACEYGTY